MLGAIISPADRINAGKLRIPPVMMESVDRLYLLGNAGAEVQQVLATTRQLERMIDDILGRTDIDDPVNHLRPHIELSQAAPERAIELIKPIHDGDV